MTRTRLAILQCLLLWMLALGSSGAAAQEFEFQAPAAVADAATPALMRDLARRILPVYKETDAARYLANLSALQMVAGDYPAAYRTRQSLRDQRRSADAGRPPGRAVLFDLYAHARAIEAGGKVQFPQAFGLSFREVVPRLNDQDAYSLTLLLGTPLPSLRNDVQNLFDRHRAKRSLTLAEAIELVGTYLFFDAQRSLGPLAGALGDEDDRSRYVTSEKVLIRTAAGIDIQARVVRPKNISKALPALLEFALTGAHDGARGSAAHGYVGVVAYTRRPSGARRDSTAPIVPFEHDGEDARAVIDWIARQPWSDGRVGMFGNGYSGFAAWAAAKGLPPALKAIATADAMAPGIDFPMEGNIFPTTAYAWAASTAHAGADASISDGDEARWRAIEQDWYRSGQSFRSLVRAGKSAKPNWTFGRWLNHPSYDQYWQMMTPVGEQFARIDIPVLSTTGYYAGGEIGSLYYFTQHLRYRPRADHTLVIGPYDGNGIHVRPSPVLRGYPVDAAALVDLAELRFQWFDHIFKGAARPSLLKDRVNYEVMGANEWQHAPTIKAMANGALRFYLDAAAANGRHRLNQAKPAGATSVEQTIDFADRKDAGWQPAQSIMSKALESRNDLAFVSEPLQQSLDINGFLSGRLDFKVNKMDLDLRFALYELLPGGDYLQLFDTAQFRTSYARDRVHRNLLAADRRAQLAFASERLMSRRVQAGSRVVLVLGINKRPDRQLNYGTGKDVSEESIKDAATPLRIEWYDSSYIDIPVRRP